MTHHTRDCDKTDAAAREEVKFHDEDKLKA